MKRDQLLELLRETARVTGNNDIVLIGSQSVHAASDTVPTEVVTSRECDVLLEEDDPLIDRIHAELGKESDFRKRHPLGLYVDAVPPGLPFLIAGWRERTRPLPTGDVTAHCLEPHDLVVAKLAAGRLKDYELITALIARKIVSVETLGERIATVKDIQMRSILLARLQIVLESAGR